MKYSIKNKTNISNDYIKYIIEFCSPSGINNFRVEIVNVDEGDYGGEATYSGKGIKIFYCDNVKYPFFINRGEHYIKSGYMKSNLIKNKDEFFVYFCAHELRHVWQFTTSKRNFFKGRKCSLIGNNDLPFYMNYRQEKDATLYADKILSKWRKLCQQK